MILNRIDLRGVDLSGVIFGDMPSTSNNVNPPFFLSCYSTGIWEMEGMWFGNDVWSMMPKQYPFLPSGLWNMEGKYRFKDIYYFGPSFLSTGYFIYDHVFRFEDKIKIVSNRSIKVSRNYWNF